MCMCCGKWKKRRKWARQWRKHVEGCCCWLLLMHFLIISMLVFSKICPCEREGRNDVLVVFKQWMTIKTKNFFLSSDNLIKTRWLIMTRLVRSDDEKLIEILSFQNQKIKSSRWRKSISNKRSMRKILTDSTIDLITVFFVLEYFLFFFSLDIWYIFESILN